jgi:3,4-dihydroxy 2-butanone 4-phosphate synthase/GTP cyclohydrolase II
MNKRIQQAIDDLKNGKPIVVVDAIDREWEGDIVLSAEKASKESLIFTINCSKGLMCLPASGEILDKLEIPLMVENSTDPLETPFTVSVDGINTGTGMSVDDRMKTIQIMLDPNSKPTDLKRPGHLFPLRARQGLLKERQGHTEASIELMKLANLKPIAIICEIMNEFGQMRKGEDLEQYTKIYNLSFISIEEIYEAVYGSTDK